MGAVSLSAPFMYGLRHAKVNRFKIGHPGASFDCLRDLEDYQLFQTAGMKGKKGDDYYFKPHNRRDKGNKGKKQVRPVYKSARSAWNQFCAWCADEGHPISAEHKAHMTQVRALVDKLVRMWTVC